MVEVLVVVAVIGITAITMSPVVKGYKSSLELNGSARELVSDLRYAQQLTIADQNEHSVVFYVLEKRYEIIKYGETNEIIKQVSLPDEIIDISITALTNDEIKYNPYGAVFEGGVISLENSKNNIKTIRVKPSGFVRIDD